MSDLTLVLLVVGIPQALALLALLFMLFRLRAPIQVTIPPPVAQVPAEWAVVLARIAKDDPWEILKRLDERVTPAPHPAIAPEQAEIIVSNIIREARLVAEQMAANNARLNVKTSGAEKQREALRYATTRLSPLNIDLDFNAISLRLEAEVAAAKEKEIK